MKPAKPRDRRIEKPRKKVGDFTALALSKAAYTLSVHDPSKLPAPGAAEIAFAGRSNAGKSSAINTLTGRKRLAYVSKTPGRTQLINFFSLDGRAFLVDLPGYGYSGVPAEVREHWELLVGEYIANRESLAVVVVVMDARHPLTPLDRQLLSWLREAGRPAHVLLTKADKLSKQAGRVTLDRVRRELAHLVPQSTAQLFSSLKGDGVDEAAGTLARLAAAKNKAPAKGE
ncbi:MAG TPA: ribosome biogenesis GTP-binding protein YihA/YsxC [Usitatibacter sp.]|nr:ribosome biogenesis GTP-binding protein YihA/YsxC [Usitatibacter sp.]